MDKTIWQNINKKLNTIKDILEDALYNPRSKEKFSDSELTELIMMSGYLHNFTSCGEEKKCSKEELKNINDILTRIKEIEKT